MRDFLPDRLARLTGSRRSAVKHLRRTIQRDRVRKRVRPEQRVSAPFSRSASGEGISGDVVEHGPRSPDSARNPQALRCQYRLPGVAISPMRIAFVARAESGEVWCLISLLPCDLDYFERYPEGVEQKTRTGRAVRRGFGLAISGARQGTEPGMWRPIE